MLPFPNFESSFTQKKVFQKGKTLYEKNKINRVVNQANGIWNVYFANETSNQESKVTVHIQDGWLSYIHCPCDSIHGPMCEHSIAALLAIKTNDKNSEESETSSEVRNVKQIF